MYFWVLKTPFYLISFGEITDPINPDFKAFQAPVLVLSLTISVNFPFYTFGLLYIFLGLMYELWDYFFI